MSYNHRAAPPPPGSYLGNGGGGGGGFSQKDVASFAPHSQAADPYTDRFAMEPMSQQPAPSHYSINSVGGGGGGGGFDGGAGSQGYFAPDKEGEGVGGWIKANKKKTCAGVCCLITLLLVFIQIIVVVKLTKIGDQTFVNHVVITDACSTNMGYQFTSTFTNPSGFGVSTKGDTSVRGIDAQGRVVFSTSVPEVSINGGENTLTFNTEMVVEDEDALAEFLEGVLNKNPSTMTLETDTTISSGGILLGFPLSRTFSQELSFDSDDEKVKEEVAEIKAELAPGDPNAEQRTVVETVDIVDDGDVNKFTLAIGAKQYMGPQTTTFDITLPPLAVKAYQTTAKVNELAEINIDGVTVLEGVADIDLTVVFNAATAANAQPKIQAILNNAEQDESIAIQGTQPNDQCFANRLVSKMTIEMPLMNRDVGGSDSGSGGGGGGGGGGDVGDEAGGGGGLPPIEVTTVDLDDVDVLDLAFTANVGLLLVEPSVTGAIPAVNAEVVNTGGPRLADVVLNVAFAAGTNEHIASLETDVTNNPITLAVQFVQFFTDPDFQARVEVGSVPGDNALDALINGLYLDVDFDPDDFAAISPI